MNGIPQNYASPLHLPFNRTALDGQFELRGPTDDPGGQGYGVMLRGSKLLLHADSALSLPFGDGIEDSLFLGLWQGKPCRLVNVDDEKGVLQGLTELSLVEEKPRLPIDLLSLGGMARMISHWVEHSRYCGRCGREVTWLPGEWGRGCSQCKLHIFPAIHPCAIVLVTRPGEVLLTRKPQWAPNRYSLVAGFQDFGESLEETAIREIAEETGVVADNVRYVGSQCWPFPSQVMVGFVAEYVSVDITVDENELADARWFAIDNLPQLPPKRSIARYILDTTLGLP